MTGVYACACVASMCRAVCNCARAHYGHIRSLVCVYICVRMVSIEKVRLEWKKLSTKHVTRIYFAHFFFFPFFFLLFFFIWIKTRKKFPFKYLNFHNRWFRSLVDLTPHFTHSLSRAHLEASWGARFSLTYRPATQAIYIYTMNKVAYIFRGMFNTDQRTRNRYGCKKRGIDIHSSKQCVWQSYRLLIFTYDQDHFRMILDTKFFF